MILYSHAIGTQIRRTGTESRRRTRLPHSALPAGRAETDLTITWVDIEPGARQVRHEHEPEQVYAIISGEGVMSVGDDERAVEAGELIHIPANTEHGLENTGDRTLEYVSAATPAFPPAEADEFYDQ